MKRWRNEKSGRIKNLCKKKGKLFYELKRGNYTEKDSKEESKFRSKTPRKAKDDKTY